MTIVNFDNTMTCCEPSTWNAIIQWHTSIFKYVLRYQIELSLASNESPTHFFSACAVPHRDDMRPAKRL
jgi:hypothetical protein